MPIRTPDGYLDITNATLRGSEIITTSKVGIANSAPTHTLSVGNKLFVDDSAANVLTVSGNLVATSLKIGQIDLTPSYGLEHVANVINTVSNVVQFTNTGTGFVSVSNVGIGTSTSPAGLLDVVGAFRMRYQDMGVTKAHIITGANSASISESGGTYTYTRGGSGNTGNFLPNPSNIVPNVGQRYRVKLTARSDYAGTIRYECPTSTIITTYDLTTSFKEYTWDFTATGTTMQFAVTTASGTTSQFNAFSIERLGTGFNVNPTSTAAPVQISGVTHFSDYVGVGTASPTSMLELAGNSGGSMITLKRTNASNGGAKGGIRFTENTNGYNVATIACLGDGANASGALCFYTKASSTETGPYLGTSDECMRITSTGTVGIGTNNPATKLHLYDASAVPVFTIEAGSSGHSNYTKYKNPNSGQDVYVGMDGTGLFGFATGSLALGTGNSHIIFAPNYSSGEKMRITTAGDIGIGTATPRNKLDVRSDNYATFGKATYNAAGWSGIRLGTPYATNHDAYCSVIESYNNHASDYNSDLRFKTSNGNNASGNERMRITSAGNVGIGTDSPIAALDIDGGANDDTTPALAIRGGLYDTSDLYVLNSYSVTTGVGYGAKVIGVNIKNKVETNNTVQIRNNVGGLTSAGAIYFGSDDTTNQGIFGVLGGTGTAGTTLAELLTVKASGYVGIGTTSPVAKLHVASHGPTYTAISGNDRFRIEEVATNGNKFGLQMGIDWGSGNSTLQTYFLNSGGTYSQSYNLLLQPHGGNVGIGTASPVEKLDVRGNAYLENNSIFMSAYNEGSTNNTVYSQYVGKRYSGRILAGMEIENVRTNSAGTAITTDGAYGQKVHFRAHDYGSYGGSVNDRTMTLVGPNVGIGVANPRAKLHVSGGAGLVSSATRVYFKYNDYNTNYNSLVINTGDWASPGIYADHAIVTNNYFVAHGGTIGASDIRIKKNIVDADDAECLEVLRLLKPKKYQYKDEIEKGEEPVWGFIAQEVRETLPYATQLRQDVLPNIYELANVSQPNVITFTNFNTSNLESNATTLIRTKGIDGEDHDIHLAEVIDAHSIRVEEDLTKWTGSVDAEGNVITEITTTTITAEEYEALEYKTEFNKNDDDTYTKTSTTYPGNQLFVYGQQVDDFVFLKKESIFTVATAALQEVDRQLQAEKVKTATLETKLQTETAALETKTTTLETELQAEKSKTTILETKTTTLETKLQEAEAKIATLQAEKEAIRSDLSSLVLRVTALES